MPRPRIFRFIFNKAKCNYFKPRGILLLDLEETILNLDELEAIRLSDHLEIEQLEAASKMNISQPTYSRILKEARKKIADALINGKAIKIDGGNYKMPNKDGTGPLGKGQKTGRGIGKCQGQKSDMIMPLRSGGGPYGKGKRFQRLKEEQNKVDNI